MNTAKNNFQPLHQLDAGTTILRDGLKYKVTPIKQMHTIAGRANEYVTLYPYLPNSNVDLSIAAVSVPTNEIVQVIK